MKAFYLGVFSLSGFILTVACESKQSAVSVTAQSVVPEEKKDPLRLKHESDSIANVRLSRILAPDADIPLKVEASAFLADNNLEAYLPLTVTNNTSKTIIGFYITWISNGSGGNKTKLGKFKRTIKPHKSTTIRIASKRFGLLSHEALERPNDILGPAMDNFIATAVYADGTSQPSYSKY